MLDIRITGDRKMSLIGRLDTSQSDAAGKALDRLTGDVEVDLSGLQYISSAGLGVFIVAHNRLKANGGSLVLAGPSDHVRHIFHLARLDTVLTIR